MASRIINFICPAGCPTYTQVKATLLLCVLLSISTILFGGIHSPQQSVHHPLVCVEKRLRAQSHEICALRRSHEHWGLEIERVVGNRTEEHQSSAAVSYKNGRNLSYAFVVTVNDGFYDFFLNWYLHYDRTVLQSSFLPEYVNLDGGNHTRQQSILHSNNEAILIIVAEDPIVYKKLLSSPDLRQKNSIVTLLSKNAEGSKNFTSEAENYDSDGYKILVSTRATYLLDITCHLVHGRGGDVWDHGINNESIHEVRPNETKWVVVYSDVDTVFLKNPIPYIEAKLLETVGGVDLEESRRTSEKMSFRGRDSTSTLNIVGDLHITNSSLELLHLKYDIVSSVDNLNVSDVDFYYCTGFFAINPTPSSIIFLSHWEKELLHHPRLNQPIFNYVIRVPLVDDTIVQHVPLGLEDFPSGKMFFETWEKEMDSAVASVKRMKTVIVHNNYIVGHDAKKKRFKEKVFWLLANSSEWS